MSLLLHGLVLLTAGMLQIMPPAEVPIDQVLDDPRWIEFLRDMEMIQEYDQLLEIELENNSEKGTQPSNVSGVRQKRDK
jgi:hypothetical protein